MEAARLKHRLRERLAEAGLAGPGFRVGSIDDDPAKLSADLRFPCILKPVHLAASRGVIRADDPAGFVDAFRRIARLLEQPELAARGGEGSRTILVEDYLPGAEVALEGLLDDGRLRVLAIFDKPDPLEGPFFEETIYVTPSRLPEPVQAEIADAVSSAAAALGLETGPVHAELRLPGGPPVLLEIAPRSIGGHCARVLRFGPERIRLEELILRHALGMDVAGLEREPEAAGVMMIPIPCAGVLRDVRGLADAQRVPGVEDVTIAIPIGQQVVPLPEGSRYLGFIFARAAQPADVEAALRAAHAQLQFDIQS